MINLDIRSPVGASVDDSPRMDRAAGGRRSNVNRLDISHGDFLFFVLHPINPAADGTDC